MLKSVGVTELLIIAVVLLILFGNKKLLELGRGLGESLKELKKSITKEPETKTEKNKGHLKN